MNKVLRYIACALLLLPIEFRAQSVVELTINGGFSTLLYEHTSPFVLRTSSVGTAFHLGYAYFLHPNIGLGTGMDAQRIGGGMTYSGEQVWRGVTDTDGERYDHHLQITNWHEQYTAYYLDIPLALYVRFPLPHVQLRFEVGAKYNIALAGRAAAHGQLSHTGYYDKWHLWLDVDEYGFYHENDFRPSQSLPLKNTFSAFLRAGVAVPLTCTCSLLLGANMQYAFTSMYSEINDPKVNALGFRNDRPEGATFHSFMNDYTPLIYSSLANETPLVSGKVTPLSLQLELGLRIELAPHSYSRHRHKHYPCRCLLF